MTIEDITQTLQRVAVAIEQLTQAAVRADDRQDSTEAARREADERIEALINAQVRYEARQERLEEAFRQVASAHAQLVELLSRHEDRLDGHDEDQARTDGRLDALIDDQISARRQAEARGRLLDEKLARLQEAQARTDEQLLLLVERNGGQAK